MLEDGICSRACLVVKQTRVPNNMPLECLVRSLTSVLFCFGLSPLKVSHVSWFSEFFFPSFKVANYTPKPFESWGTVHDVLRDRFALEDAIEHHIPHQLLA
jgi:hypothetical protein